MKNQMAQTAADQCLGPNKELQRPESNVAITVATVEKAVSGPSASCTQTALLG